NHPVRPRHVVVVRDVPVRRHVGDPPARRVVPRRPERVRVPEHVAPPGDPGAGPAGTVDDRDAVDRRGRADLARKPEHRADRQKEKEGGDSRRQNVTSRFRFPHHPTPPRCPGAERGRGINKHLSTFVTKRPPPERPYREAPVPRPMEYPPAIKTLLDPPAPGVG